MWETDLSGEPVVVEDLDANRLLSVLADKERTSRETDRGKLRLAVQWCVLHPATADTGVATWEDANLPGALGADESLGRAPRRSRRSPLSRSPLPWRSRPCRGWR